MNEITYPLYPKRTLFKALIGAIILASAIFITLVLPAEYQSDPTGVGALLGLNVLSAEAPTEQVTQLPVEATAASGTQPKQKNVVTVTVPPRKGVEYKFSMNQYAQMDFNWTTDGEALYFDFHGEPKGDTTGYFKSYTITTAKEVKGSITVPFDGVHGWYWKNTSNKTIIVTLETEGVYEVVGLIH
jgi:hypothetical protein